MDSSFLLFNFSVNCCVDRWGCGDWRLVIGAGVAPGYYFSNINIDGQRPVQSMKGCGLCYFWGCYEIKSH